MFPLTIHGGFRAQVAARPDAVALAHGTTRTSYRDLDAASDAVAAQLRAAGLGPGSTVGVLVPRSPELVAVLLGVLKLGAGYSVLDRSWPPARLAELHRLLAAPLVVTDPAAAPPGLPTVVLTGGGLTGWAAGGGLTEWTVDGGPAGSPGDSGPAGSAGDGREPGRRHEPVAGPDDETRPAQIFFTSGSTGQPKAAVTPHGAMTRLLRDCRFVRFGPDTVMPLGAPPSWDAFGLELWGPLLHGGTAVVPDGPHLDPATLRRGIAEHGVNTAWLGAALFNVIVDEDVEAFTGLRHLVIGGERLSPGHVRRFLRAHPSVPLTNGYGPVECTVFVATHRITPADCDDPYGIPLGHPVNDTEIHVLAPDGTPCPPGERGEICIGGPRLSLGYLGDEAETAARFVTRRIDGQPRRLYRTGDLGRWSESGLLRFEGRVDRQVKIRGHRIAPEEIEQALVGITGVSRCAVVPVPTGAGTELVAYYTADPGAAVVDERAVRSALARRLPSYLVPHRVHRLPAMPLLPNGKLDWATLREMAAGPPEPGPTPAPAADPAPAPDDRDGDDPVRVTVREVLGDRAPGAGENLVEAGATSLELIRICARLGRRLGRPVPVSQLVGQPTVAALSAWLATTVPAEPPTGPAGPPGSPVPLLPMQAGFLFADALIGDAVAHCALVWQVDGPVDEAALAAAVGDLVDRHEALRARYELGEQATATPAPSRAVPVRRLPVAVDEEAALRAATEVMMQPLRPDDGEVCRVVRATNATSARTVLGLVVHHVAWDVESERIAVAELSAGYRARLTGVPASLPPAPTLAEIGERHQRRLALAPLAAQREFWRRELADLPGPTLRRPHPAGTGPDGTATAHVGSTGPDGEVPVAFDVAIGPGLVDAADTLAARIHGTRFAVLLTAFAVAVATVTGDRDFGVGVPVNKRGDECLDRAVGCLIDTVCVRLRPDPRADPVPGARATATTLRAALAAQDVTIDEVVRLCTPRGLGADPLYRLMFTVQPHDVPPLELPGARTRGWRPDPPRSMTDLGCALWPTGDGGYRARITYRPDRVDGPVATAVGRHLRAWLAGLAEPDHSGTRPGGTPPGTDRPTRIVSA